MNIKASKKKYSPLHSIEERESRLQIDFKNIYWQDLLSNLSFNTVTHSELQGGKIILFQQDLWISNIGCNMP